MTRGGSSRAVTDQQFEGMCDQFKVCGWEYTLTDKEKKAMVKDAEVPQKCFEHLIILTNPLLIKDANFSPFFNEINVKKTADLSQFQ